MAPPLSDCIDSEAETLSDADSTSSTLSLSSRRPPAPPLFPLPPPTLPPQSPPVFQWYAVRAPSLRTAPVCKTALAKRHVIVSHSCLQFRRVYELQAARDAAPQPLHAFPG